MSGSVTASKSQGKAASSLNYLLASGSSRVLNASQISFGLKKNGDAKGLLFQTAILNQCIFFKELMQADAPVGSFTRVGTKVYVPFNREKPDEGGNTFFYAPSSLVKILSSVIDLSDPVRRAMAEADGAILAQLDELPTFAPFLLRECFERAHIEADPIYSTISPEEWDEIRLFIRKRFQQILEAVTGGAATQQSLEHLLDKLWDLNDRSMLESLAGAFGLPKSNCAETFYAWKGILYFSWLSVSLKDDVEKLSEWLLEWKVLTKSCPSQSRAQMVSDLQKIRKQVLSEMAKIDHIQSEYDEAFDELFVKKTGPHHFLQFLGNAPSYFHAFGGAIGTLQHAVEVWSNLTAGFPDRVPSNEILDEVTIVLQDILPKSM
jgi:hypothetical protein